MKKLICVLLPVVTGLFIAFHVTAQLETKENLRVIVKFNENVIPDNTLTTQTKNIQSETIQNMQNLKNKQEIQYATFFPVSGLPSPVSDLDPCLLLTDPCLFTPLSAHPHK